MLELGSSVQRLLFARGVSNVWLSPGERFWRSLVCHVRNPVICVPFVHAGVIASQLVVGPHVVQVIFKELKHKITINLH